MQVASLRVTLYIPLQPVKPLVLLRGKTFGRGSSETTLATSPSLELISHGRPVHPESLLVLKMFY